MKRLLVAAVAAMVLMALGLVSADVGTLMADSSTGWNG
jgi:hypothetical protein